MIFPEFLWDNVIRGITASWSGTTVVGKEPANGIDWRDFSLFEANTGNLDYTMTADTDISALSVFVRNSNDATQTIVLQYESSPATYTTLATVNPAGGKLTYDKFSEVTVLSGRNIRFVITATTSLDIRQLVVGVPMIAEQGQYLDATDPTLLNGVKYSNTISMNGSIIGRSIKRLDRTGELNLDNLTASWIRSTWEPFAAHAAKYPFIYLWNYRDYPNAVAFSTCDLKVPQHNGRGDRSTVSGPLHNLVADENQL